LSAEQRASLEGTLENLQRSKGSQVVILMMPTTQPESIEQFGIRLAGAWKIGRKGVHDGVIMLVAKDDRRVRIEVGYGLEGAIPDAIAMRIVSDIMTPKFKLGDFYGGLQAGVAAIAAAVDNEPLPAPEVTPAERTTGNFSLAPRDWLFFAVALVAAAGVAHRLFGMVGSGLAAMVAGFLGWLLFSSLMAAIVAAIVVFVASFMRGGGGFYGGGGMGGGGFGGGFSGGGGSFGGGGASGRW
jgi:uncharacterized protein